MVLQDAQYTQKAGWALKANQGQCEGTVPKARWGEATAAVLQRQHSQGSLSVMKSMRNTKNPHTEFSTAREQFNPDSNSQVSSELGLTHGFLVITSQEIIIFKEVCESPNCLLMNPSHTQLQHFKSLSAHKALQQQWRNPREAAPVLHWTHRKNKILPCLPFW